MAAELARRPPRWFEADAVVVDLEHHVPVGLRDPHGDVMRLGVGHDVADALLRGSEQECLDVAVELEAVGQVDRGLDAVTG